MRVIGSLLPAYYLCQGTLFFSNISAVYSSFPSTAFYFASLYYPSMMSTIIFPDISEHCIESPLPFYYSFLCFSAISIRWTLMDFEMYFTYKPCVHFYLHSCLFLSLFSFSFLMLSCLTFYLQGLIFLSHIVIDFPLAGLDPFLLKSPARCASYCNYFCQ